MDNGVLLMVALPVIVASFFCLVAAFRLRTEEHPPFGSLNPKNWVPLHKMKRFYTPRGYRYHVVGWSLFYLNGALMIYYYLSK
ncbi:MAG: hypothetical protein P1R58_10270 [bacterium]|nr:hypothetical protein [bacterium]